MPEPADERDQLIADLLEEAHGLRMKLEDFSQYTESKVAEFVQARQSLTAERDSAQQHLSLAQHDVQVFRLRQDQMQRQLIELTRTLEELNGRIERLTKQRDNARNRIRALEASRGVRIATRLNKLLRRG
jgi:chromosome segregation ATPase